MKLTQEDTFFNNKVLKYKIRYQKFTKYKALDLNKQNFNYIDYSYLNEYLYIKQLLYK